MPEIEAPQQVKKKKSFKAFKRKLYHEVVYEILRSVRQAQKSGGFRAMWRGRCALSSLIFLPLSGCLGLFSNQSLHRFMPFLCLIVNDNPEGQLLALVYNSAKAKFPCRCCW